MEQIITRHRHELKRRTLTVAEAHRLTPHMIRIVFTCGELADFTSLAPDVHIKLFFPTGEEKPEMRDYTPRAFDPVARSLTVDFFVHEAGPATSWAVQARPGDELQIGGPRGSAVVAPVFDWWLLIGDETALPAIGRWVEALPADVWVFTLAAVPGQEDEQTFATAAHHLALWHHRPAAESAQPTGLVDAARQINLPDGKGFIWIAAEAGVAHALRDHFTEERGHPRNWMKAAGYWVRGQADASDKKLD